jgi:hypothetical protein
MMFPVRFTALLRQSMLGILPVLLTLLLAAGPIFAAASWALNDGSGHRLNAKIFEQPFPEYSSGMRIRFNALDSSTTLDHQQQLVVSDSMGQEWSLPNRSEEIVPKRSLPIPSGSAQFDLSDLMPSPSEALPLHLTVPTADGVLSFDLNPEQTMALHSIGSEQRSSDQA